MTGGPLTCFHLWIFANRGILIIQTKTLSLSFIKPDRWCHTYSTGDMTWIQKVQTLPLPLFLLPKPLGCLVGLFTIWMSLNKSDGIMVRLNSAMSLCLISDWSIILYILEIWYLDDFLCNSCLIFDSNMSPLSDDLVIHGGMSMFMIIFSVNSFNGLLTIGVDKDSNGSTGV